MSSCRLPAIAAACFALTACGSSEVEGPKEQIIVSEPGQDAAGPTTAPTAQGEAATDDEVVE